MVFRSEDINIQGSLRSKKFLSYFSDYKINIYYKTCKGKNIKQRNQMFLKRNLCMILSLHHYFMCVLYMLMGIYRHFMKTVH